MATTALIIFCVTYAGIIFTRLPGITIDRPSAAFFGAVAMVLAGVLSFDEAIRAIDFNTIALLLGMMILIAVLELDGLFTFIAEKTISYSGNRSQLLALVVGITGIASAFLVNDAVVLLFTPVVIRICRSARLNPVPYLTAEIMASNIGSAMTITGNPQNIIIGISSGIEYGKFLLYLLPVSLAGMVIVVYMVRMFFKEDFNSGARLVFHGNESSCNFDSMRTSVPVFAGVVLLFFLSPLIGISIPMIALLGASLILIFGKIKPSSVIRKVDWVLLLFFSGLFIVVQGVVKSGVLGELMDFFPLSNSIEGIGSIHFLSLILSQVVSNVPFTILMLPFLRPVSSRLLWLSLASGSTLAGNATIVGAMANLIVIESAEAQGVKIGFWPFLRIGMAITLVTLMVSVLVLYAEFRMGII